MPPVVVPQAVLLSCRGSVLGQPWANVIGVNVLPGGGGGLLLDQAVADEFGAVVRGFYDGLTPLLSTQWSLTEVVVQDLQSASAPSYEASITPVTGTISSDPLPPNMAVCCTHRTGLRGRSFRGRTYLAGWTEQALDSTGQLTAAYAPAIEGEWADFRTALGTVDAGGMVQAVVSRTLATATPVVDTIVDLQFDHQDRRKR